MDRSHGWWRHAVVLSLLPLLAGCALVSPSVPQAYQQTLAHYNLPLVAPPSEAPPPSVDVERVAAQVHSLVNRVRTEAGQAPLAWCDDVAQVAQAHSTDMASGNYFSHTDQHGRSATDRGTVQGITCQRRSDTQLMEGLGENLFWTTQYDSYELASHSAVPMNVAWKEADQIAEEAVTAWLKSPGHRANLLSALYTKQGIGVAIRPGVGVYITQNFCF
ncbi:MAG: CAP domain-containing protein [Bacteroidota bacterium]